MPTAKEEVHRLLRKLPADASFEDIQYHIRVCQKITRGLEDAAEDRVLDQHEAERRIAAWLEKSAGRKQLGPI